MGNTLYLECYCGISGDMTVASLLDLGADKEALDKALGSLQVKGFKTEVRRVKKSGLDACDFNVVLDEDHENHDHDMEYLHGHGHSHDEHHHHEGDEHDHSYEGHHHHDDDEHGHSHEGHHHHGHHHHDHEHRGLPEIMDIIEKAEMTDRAKAMAERIFTILAEAESKAHGVPMDQVHFHEVGAVDSIVDIVATAVCLDNLDITEVIVPQLCEGQGSIRCQHGIIPVPVPAVMNIAQAYDLTLKITDVTGELVTPTGAAIVAAVKTSEKLPEKFVIERTGIGAGKRLYERPSLLRAMIIKSVGGCQDEIYKLETNIDDCSSEHLGYVMDVLLDAGARDVHFIPVFMKKNRPAYQLNVLCKSEDIAALESIIFSETSTIGIRRVRMERSILERHMAEIETPIGKATVKVCVLPDGTKRYYPEYDCAAALAREHGISLYEAMDKIRAAIESLF